MLPTFSTNDITKELHYDLKAFKAVKLWRTSLCTRTCNQRLLGVFKSILRVLTIVYRDVYTKQLREFQTTWRFSGLDRNFYRENALGRNYF